ncbi:hypothetical protein ACSMXN_00980 [Jatrophihabitans sp. DSM 45814]
MRIIRTPITRAATARFAATAVAVGAALLATACSSGSSGDGDTTKACAAFKAGDATTTKFDSVKDIASFKALVAEQVGHLKDFADNVPATIRPDAQAELSAAKNLQGVVDSARDLSDLSAKSADVKKATDAASGSESKLTAWTTAHCT